MAILLGDAFITSSRRLTFHRQSQNYVAVYGIQPVGIPSGVLEQGGGPSLFHVVSSTTEVPRNIGGGFILLVETSLWSIAASKFTTTGLLERHNFRVHLSSFAWKFTSSLALQRGCSGIRVFSRHTLRVSSIPSPSLPKILLIELHLGCTESIHPSRAIN